MTSRLCRVALAVAACAGLSACENPEKSQSSTSQTAPSTAATTNQSAAATAPAGELLGSADSAAAAPKHTNRLANEKSPYLLQHAHNPVDWRPCGTEALVLAVTLRLRPAPRARS